MEIDALLLKEIYNEIKYKNYQEIFGFSDDDKIHKEKHKKIIRRIPRSAINLFEESLLCNKCFPKIS
jgi:hypothetical protein